jgi:hypothetical protein
MRLDKRVSSIQHSSANHSSRRQPTRAARWICGLLVFFVLAAGAAFSHPMGNFSINHYSKITVGQKSIDVLYLIDMAEIPTYQEMRQAGFSPKADDPNIAQYLDQQGKALEAGLTLQSDGRAIELAAISHQVVFADGAGGLPTMKRRGLAEFTSFPTRTIIFRGERAGKKSLFLATELQSSKARPLPLIAARN